jgi:hypothetical protein
MLDTVTKDINTELPLKLPSCETLSTNHDQKMNRNKEVRKESLSRM